MSSPFKVEIQTDYNLESFRALMESTRTFLALSTATLAGTVGAVSTTQPGIGLLGWLLSICSILALAVAVIVCIIILLKGIVSIHDGDMSILGKNYQILYTIQLFMFVFGCVSSGCFLLFVYAPI